MSPCRLGALAGAFGLLLALVAPALGANAEGTVTIRLADVPSEHADDPRANQYFVDHAQPGATLTRTVEVRNGTSDTVAVDLYAGGANVDGDEFVFGDGRERNELSAWTTVSPGKVSLKPGATSTVQVQVTVPPDVDDGERYGVVWAELEPVESGGVRTVNRVGVRMYISVGTGEAPVGDFTVDSVEATRQPDGSPVALVAVTNTGERALDVTGELGLAGGPGGASAGPFTTTGATTVAPGATTTLEITAPADLPGGPWDAEAIVRSGSLEKRAGARISFPSEVGRSTGPVAALAEAAPAPDAANGSTPIAGIAGAVVAGLSALAGGAMVVRGRILRHRSAA